MTGRRYKERFWGADNVLFLHLGTGYIGALKNSLSCMFLVYFKDIYSKIIYNGNWKLMSTLLEWLN